MTETITDVMEAPVRQIYGKVIINYTDPNSDQGLTITTSGAAYGADTQDIANNLEVPEAKHLQLGMGLLDGTYHPTGTGEIGWWSDVNADENGEFDPGVWIQAVCVARPITTLKLVGDSLLDEYPVDFEIKLYTAGDTLVHTETVTGNTDVDWGLDIADHADIVKMKATITKWSTPGACAKIMEFFTVYTEEYDGDDLISINLLEEMQYESETIPMGNISSNEITLTLNNYDRHFDPDNPSSPIRNLMLKNRVITAYLGAYVDSVLTWYPLGTFWSVEWSVPVEGITATIRGLDRIDQITNQTAPAAQIIVNNTMYQLAETVMQAGGLIAGQYSIDTALQDITIPYAWFNDLTCREALKRMAQAALAVVYCDRDGVLCMNVLTPQEAPVFVFTDDNYFTRDNPLAWNELANYIEVNAIPYIMAEGTTVYNDTETVTVSAGATSTYSYFFMYAPVYAIASITLTGATNVHVESYTFNSFSISIHLHNSGETDETITGLTIVGTAFMAAGGMQAIGQDAESIALNGKSKASTISNEFIQTRARAQEIAFSLIASYKDPRKDVILSARGSPHLKLGDRITAPVYEDVTADYTIIRQNLVWDGGLKVDITGRKIPTEA